VYTLCIVSVVILVCRFPRLFGLVRFWFGLVVISAQRARMQSAKLMEFFYDDEVWVSEGGMEWLI
jgi:hypothetical protein